MQKISVICATYYSSFYVMFISVGVELHALKDMLKSQSLVFVNVILFANGGFADMTKMQVEMRSYGSRVGPSSSVTGVLIRRAKCCWSSG